MARIRTIKPSAASSASLIRCSHSARLLFLQGWCFYDDEGVHAFDALQLKAEIFPADDCTEQQVRAWIDELVAQDCLAVFEVPATDDPQLKHYTGQKFLIHVNWHHQKIDHPTPTRAPIRNLWLQSIGHADPGQRSFSRPSNHSHAQAAPTADTDKEISWKSAANVARENFSGLGMRSKQDKNLLLKICHLTLEGILPGEWLTEAAEYLHKAHARNKPGHKPGALLMSIYKKKTQGDNPPRELRELLAKCPEPDIDLLNAPAKTEPTAAPQEIAPTSQAAVDEIVAKTLKAAPPPVSYAKRRAEIARQLREAAKRDDRKNNA